MEEEDFPHETDLWHWSIMPKCIKKNEDPPTDMYSVEEKTYHIKLPFRENIMFISTLPKTCPMA